MIPADQALHRLVEGNLRFASGVSGHGTRRFAERRAEHLDGQRPFAAILGCSDSRVPPEIVFDQGLGELFIVRVAGNVAGALEVASLEFAVAELGVRLVVVLGHEACGAIAATLEQIRRPTEGLSASLAALVERIRPAVEGESAEDAVVSNIRAVSGRLREDSAAIADRVARGELAIVEAVYSLESGLVAFREGPEGHRGV